MEILLVVGLIVWILRAIALRLVVEGLGPIKATRLFISTVIAVIHVVSLRMPRAATTIVRLIRVTTATVQIVVIFVATAVVPASIFPVYRVVLFRRGRFVLSKTATLNASLLVELQELLVI